MQIKECPWERDRMCPSNIAIESLVNFIETRNIYGDFLEIGAGYSTWFLSQLPFNSYFTVETFKPTLDILAKYYNGKGVILDKWDDIPYLKYQYVFIDSNVGGDALWNERHKPLLYILDKGLLANNGLIIVHDYFRINRYRKNPTLSRKGRYYIPWYNMEKDYNLKVIATATKEFGIYRKE